MYGSIETPTLRGPDENQRRARYHAGSMGPSDSPSTPPGTGPTAEETGGSGLREQVEAILNLMRPAVQADGGDLELVGVTDAGVIRVRFHGACVGCPSSSLTLQAGIERNLKLHVPGVSRVEAVD